MTETPAPPRRRRMSISVRTRIVAALTVAAALCMTAVGFSVYLVERHRILEGIDERLLANLESARFLTAEGDPDIGPVEIVDDVGDEAADEGAVGTDRAVAVTWESSSAALSTVLRRMSPDDNTGAMGMVDRVITTVPGIPLDVDLRDQNAFARYLQRQLEAREPVIGTFVEDDVA